VYTRASPTDILARKSARRTKVRGLCRRAELAARAAAGRPTAAARRARARRTRRFPREDPRAEVSEEVRVGVRVGPVEFKLCYSKPTCSYVSHNEVHHTTNLLINKLEMKAINFNHYCI